MVYIDCLSLTKWVVYIVKMSDACYSIMLISILRFSMRSLRIGIEIYIDLIILILSLLLSPWKFTFPLSACVLVDLESDDLCHDLHVMF